MVTAREAFALLEGGWRRSAERVVKYVKAHPRQTAAVAMGSCFALSAAWSCGSCTASMWTHEEARSEEEVAALRESLVVVGKKTVGSVDEVCLVAEDMRAVFKSGHSLPLSKRKEQLQRLEQLIEENADAICNACYKDLGRPRHETEFYDMYLPLHSVRMLARNLHLWTATAQVRQFVLLTFPSAAYIVKEPYGVALIIGTWNYPLLLTLVPLAGAIAAGNTVVIKPSNVAKHSALLIARLCRIYLDPLIVTVVGPEIEGDRATVTALLETKFDVAFFTGSPSVGRLVAEACGRHLTPCTLELGGKNPCIVDGEASEALVRRAAFQIVWGRLMNSGQQCIAPDYVLCCESAGDVFLEACVEAVEAMYPTPSAPGHFGRLVNEKQVLRLQELLATHGGEVVCGGGTSEGESRYVAPTVVKVALESGLMQEELFGPVLPVCMVKDVSAAVDIVRNRHKPLALYLFSKSRKTQQYVLRNTSAGGVTVNGTLWHVAHPNLPFGGVGESGMGAYHGRHTIDAFQHHKPVLKKHTWFDPFFIYPPDTPFKRRLRELVLRLAQSSDAVAF